MQTGTILFHPDMLRLFSGRMNPLGPIPCYRLFKAQDDWLFVACGNPTFFNKFCLALEHPEWVADPRYERAPWGILPEDRDELANNIAAVIATKPREEWLRILRENDVPCAPVTSRQEFMEWRQTIHNGMRVEIDDPELGKTVQMGVPIRLSDTPGEIKGPAPRLGENTAEVQSSRFQVQSSTSDIQSLEPNSQIQNPPLQHSGLRTSDFGPRTPLDGVLVLDFASYIAGTLGPMMLAQLGANVVKVETFQGDAFRSFGFTVHRAQGWWINIIPP